MPEAPSPPDVESWLLSAQERGNPATCLDNRHADGAAWTRGNEVRPLVHGAVYFAELLEQVNALVAGDLLLFSDWSGDPDQRLAVVRDSAIADVLCAAARRGAIVKGLVWRSHLDLARFTSRENRHLGEYIDAAGGEGLLDMRVRAGGSHHQKFVVLRHPGRAERDVAYVGGIDLCHGRRDDALHGGDQQARPIAAAYGDRPPWHDLQVAIRGPAVGDVEAVFRERWQDPAPLTRSPVRRLSSILRRDDRQAGTLPAQLPDPAPRGAHTVQLLRTYPARRRGYPFAPDGERSVARAHIKVLQRARSLIYIEDQYFWSAQVARPFAAALAANPNLHLMMVLPRYPDADGRFSGPPNLLGHQLALEVLYRAGGPRVAVYGIENHAGTPVYVHAKTCIIDDVWASVGSDNFNRRSWTHDSELSCAVLDDTADEREPPRSGEQEHPARRYARDLRLTLAREHLDRPVGQDLELCDPRAAFAAFAQSAVSLDGWHTSGRQGPRPPGRLRTYRTPQLSRWTIAWAAPLYRTIYDPDGRPADLRRADTV
ncbi:phospholipase D family protein [Nocardioides sp. LS1]|uniref:phospholipase D family protein n=1 Tax=Nocardioides sp. LS1 TaxID=1027620 RepID=UPI000F627768|nr:phospholipase D family protein [Nocardioides sp. LS1]GCD91958.1 phospholipase D [Nocardioides sp. LS1]